MDKDSDKKDKDAQLKPADKPGDLTESEKKRKRDDWTKEKKDLEERVEDARTFSQQAIHYYTWGMMFGFLCLAIAGVGFLGPNQPVARKVVGAIVLCALIVAIFYFYFVAFVLFSARGMF